VKGHRAPAAFSASRGRRLSRPGDASFRRRTLDVVLPVIKYMLARLVLFVLAVTLLGVLGAGRELALVGGLLISALLAYVLLGRLRDASTVAIVDRVQTRSARRRAARADEDALYEDALVDAQTDESSESQESGHHRTP
jgi:Protein of unknown function (DUF4229)